MVERSFNIGGWRPVGKTRVRAGLFGIAVAEELWENRDGRCEWRKASGVIIQQEATPRVD
jgi:hypothetical protein